MHNLNQKSSKKQTKFVRLPQNFNEISLVWCKNLELLTKPQQNLYNYIKILIKYH